MSTHNIPFSIYQRKSPNIVINLQLWDFFQGTQERVRNSCGKRAISVRATEVLLYWEDVVSILCCSITISFRSAVSLGHHRRLQHSPPSDPVFSCSSCAGKGKPYPFLNSVFPHFNLFFLSLCFANPKNLEKWTNQIRTVSWLGLQV